VEDILELGSTDSLRLTFTTKEGQSNARPHQSFILIEDPAAKLDVSIPVSVKASGKAKIDLVT
jgi:oligosaccharyltransferase complex subunit delta (ribophorin II)